MQRQIETISLNRTTNDPDQFYVRDSFQAYKKVPMKRMNVLAIATLLMTIVGTLPAIAQSDETAKRFHVFPQLADGGGWLSVLSVTNVSQSSSFCTFELHGLSLDRFSEVSGITASGSTATFSLAGAGGYVAWRTKDESALASGYATLDCTAPTVAQVLYASGNQSDVTGMTASGRSPGIVVSRRILGHAQRVRGSCRGSGRSQTNRRACGAPPGTA